MYNKTGNILARFLSRHAVLTLNGFNSIKDLLSHFSKVVAFASNNQIIQAKRGQNTQKSAISRLGKS